MFEQRKAEEEMLQLKENDWDYLFQLAGLFKKFRLDDENMDEDTDVNKNAPGHVLSSKGEYFLAKAFWFNMGIVRFSFVRPQFVGGQQINKNIVRNFDIVRQARRHHAIATGTLEKRKRNTMEQFFDVIAANDPSVTEVNIVGDLKFLSLNAKEKIKVGAAFVINTHVTTVEIMNQLKLDDHY